MMKTKVEGTHWIMRHTHKGSTEITEIIQSSRLSEDERSLVNMVLNEEEFSSMRKEGKIPLTLEGVIRAIRLADHIFNNILLTEADSLRNRQILVFSNSEKNRTQLTRALVAARIAQLESDYNVKKMKEVDQRFTRSELEERVKQDHDSLLEQKQKQSPQTPEELHLDTLLFATRDFMKLLNPIDEPTWEPYRKMMEEEGISEDEALLRWVQDMNILWHQGQASNPNMDQPVDAKHHPELGAEKYREAIRLLAQTIHSKDPNVPVLFFLFGHSDPLAQILYDTCRKLNSEDMPQFCQMFHFDDKGNFTGDKFDIESPQEQK